MATKLLPDAVCTAVTVTPGSTPPLLSVIVPVNAASWAKPLRGTVTSAQIKNVRASRLFTSAPLHWSVVIGEFVSEVHDSRIAYGPAREQATVHLRGRVFSGTFLAIFAAWAGQARVR